MPQHTMHTGKTALQQNQPPFSIAVFGTGDDDTAIKRNPPDP